MKQVKCRSLFILITMLFFIFIGCAENEENNDDNPYPKNDIIIDETTFPDDLFREYIKDEIDKDRDDKLSSNEIAAVEEICINALDDEKYANLSSIEGIAYFEKLKDLRILYCQLKDIDVSNNIYLNTLCIDSERLNVLDISNNKELQCFVCRNSKLNTIDLSNNTKLKELTLNDKTIKNIDLSNNTKIEELDLSGTGLEELDVTKITNLKSISVCGTELNELNLSNNIDLQFIEIINTPMKIIDTSNNSELLSIYCQNTNIQIIDLSNNPKVYEVECNESTKIIGEEQLTLLERFSE